MELFRNYHGYNTTEIPWYPRVPSHWTMDRAKWSISSHSNGTWGSEPNGDDDIICLRVADFDRTSLKVNKNKLTARSVPLSDREERLLGKGYLLIEKSGGGEQQLVGAVVQFDETFEAVTSNFIARIVPNDNVVSRFLVYVHAHLYSGRVNLRSINQTTGIQNLDTRSYFDEVIAYPPIEEQRAIASFLDFKTAQIDTLTVKRRALLKRLAEKRRALISQAVTQEMDASTESKDSGIPALGSIPANWNAIRLRFVCDFVTSGSRGWAEYFSNEGSVFLRITNVSRKGIDLLIDDIQRVLPPDSAEGQRTYTQGGDVVISITADLGSVAAIPDGFESAFVSQHLALVRPNPKRIVGRWLAYQVFSASGQSQLVGAGYGGTKIQLGLQDIKNVWIALPSVEEQQAICARLDSMLFTLDQHIETVEMAIESLIEFRSSLISHAVTGQIDVRDISVPEPEVSANPAMEA